MEVETGARAIQYGGERRAVGCGTFPLRIAYPVNAAALLREVLAAEEGVEAGVVSGRHSLP